MKTPRKLSGAADWLALAAAPTFAVMTLVAATGSDMLCMASPVGGPVGGMVPMYLLMSVFHVGPWLRLLAAAPPACRAHS